MVKTLALAGELCFPIMSKTASWMGEHAVVKLSRSLAVSQHVELSHPFIKVSK